MSPGTEARRWRRRSEARPAEILGAAADVFVERGFAGAPMEEIARRAGVTKGTLYLYYPSKDELFRAVVRETILPNVVEGERRAREWTGSSADLLATVVRTWWARMGETRSACAGKMVMAEAANFPEMAKFYLREVAYRGRRVFEAIVRRGIERGEFRADIDVPHAVRVIMGPMFSALLHKHSLEPFDEEPLDYATYFEHHIDFTLRALRRATEEKEGDG